ncbi:MAG: hypothetical protein ABIB47_06175 [Candidatus Woesearchaeota archaeon]
MSDEGQEQYSPEQMQRYESLFQQLVDFDREIDELLKKGPLAPVFRRRLVMDAYARKIGPFEQEVPGDLRNGDFSFDIGELVRKLDSPRSVLLT